MNKNKRATIIVLSFIVAFAMSLSLSILNLNDIDNVENIYSVVIRKIVKIDVLKSLMVFIASYYFLKSNWEIKSDKKRKKVFINLLAVIFAIVTIIGYSYNETNSWKYIFNDLFQFQKAMIITVAYYILFRAFINLVFYRIIPSIKNKTSENKLYKFIFEKHSFIIPLLIIIVCWLPYITAYYPGVLMPDSRNQIKQYYGLDLGDETASNSVKLIDENVKITNHHPVLHTVLLGKCVEIGKSLGNDNLGIFIYTIMQVALLACSFAYIINFMKKMGTNKWIRVLGLLIFSLVPIIPFYAIEVTKDVPFTALIIFYTIQLYCLIKNASVEKPEEEKKISIKNVLLIILTGLGICLTRNNGLYTILLSLPFVMIIDKLNRKRILATVMTILVLYESFIHIVLPICKIPNGSIQEALSIPLQQTARYVKEYGNDVTEEEKNIIDKLLEYDTLAERYSPRKSDKVKNKFNKDYTKEDLVAYFKVWVTQFFRHPDSYIQAYLNNYYGYLYINSDVRVYEHAKPIADRKLNETGLFEYNYPKSFEKIRFVTYVLIKASKDLPIISWITNIGVNNWIILIMTTYLLCKKKYRYIIYLLPSLSLLLVCYASPVNAYYRYAIPNIFAMPLLISIFFDIVNKEEKRLGEEKV